MSTFRRMASYILLVSAYGVTWLVAVVAKVIPRRRWEPNGRIMVTGTFFNPNWYLSHITPLTRSGVKEVILVIDEPQQPLPGVTFACPPKWLATLISRGGAKAVWMIVAGLRYRPDLYMGYYIAPGACSALLAGSVLGRPSCYQMTAGPVEIQGGGFQATGSFSASLRRPSRLIEAMALAVVRFFDLVVVRGSKAKEFFCSAQFVDTSVAIITGSVERPRPQRMECREIDLVFIGRLAPTKQAHQFIEVVAAASQVLPSIKAVIVGDGPLMEDMKAKAVELGLGRELEFLGKRADVMQILGRSKVFVLTSQSEGLSIALAEAMSSGVVPIVADVGELSDLVVNGDNGYLVAPNSICEYVDRALSVLQDPNRWEECSQRAVETALAQCGIDVISKRWHDYLKDTIASASGTCILEVAK